MRYASKYSKTEQRELALYQQGGEKLRCGCLGSDVVDIISLKKVLAAFTLLLLGLGRKDAGKLK